MSPQGSTFPTGIMLLVVLVLILVLAILLAITLHRARKKAAALPATSGNADAERPLSQRLSGKGMLLSFSRGLSYLKQRAAGRDYRYEVPWLLMLGAREAGTTTVLANAGGSAPMSREGGHTFGVPGGPEWWFYERGLVINAPGDTVRRADGRTSDQMGWFALLQLLVRRRARRPLDAVVLTISAEELLETPNAPASTDLTTRADVLCQKLSELRRAASMRLPVYVLVTKCDLVPGFSSFAGELPRELHGEIFGWSNPYPLEAAFSPDWVDECCREMHRRIVEQQMEIFVERNQLEEPDGVFLFPAQFETLHGPLRQYLAYLFHSTAYQESYYFRGIYFCGDVAAATVREAAPVSAMAMAAVSGGGPVGTAFEETSVVPAAPAITMLRESRQDRERRPIFLHDLFERKIFPESVLARPLSVIDMSRNRTVLTAQILTLAFVLVMGTGLLVKSLRFSSLKHQYLGPLFQTLADDLNKSDLRKARLGRETAAERDARLLRSSRDASNVLRSIGLFSERRLRSIFFPASWDGAADRDMQRALAKAFGTIVLDGFRVDLTLRLAGLIQATTPHTLDSPSSNGSDDTVSVGKPATLRVFDSFTNVPEYQAWGQYITGLRELEENIGRYNRIAAAGAGNSNDFQGLLKYLQLETDLPPDFDFNDPYLEEMLREATNQQFPFHNPDDQVVDDDDAVKHAHELIEGFFTTWFGPGNRLGFDVDQMTSNIDRIPSRGGDVQYQVLKDIADSISRVSEDLENPAFDWLNGDDFDLAQFPAFNQPINDLEYLTNLPFPNEINDHGKSGYRRFTTELARKSTRLTGQVLTVDQVPVQVTSSVAALQANLRILLDQVFVAREPGPVQRLDAGKAIWDRNTLLEADKLFDAYDRYTKGALRTAPPVIRDALQRVALGRLQDNALDYVGEAQNAVPPGSPEGTDTQSFTQSLDVLQRLLSGFGKFQDPAAARSFTSVLTSQAGHMLLVLQQDLNSRNLYSVRDQNFDWWEGEKPLSLAAYDVRSADDLKDYTDRQRDQVTMLAQQADPVAKFLQPRAAGLGTQEARALAFWQGTLQELKKYTDKAPGNSVQLLEDFVRTGMDKVAPDGSCQDSTRDPAGRSDYFLTRRAALRTGALARCRVLAQRAYTTQIAATFNRRLAGRFPFSTTPPQNALQEADPAGVAEFYGKFDQYGKIAADTLNQTVPAGKARDAALGFLSQITAIRPVFAAFLMSAEKNPAPAFDFVVNFRVNRNHEIEGNQIADWGLEVGQQSFQPRAKENTGHWKLGDPIRLSLRFADDSPSVPATDNNQPAMNVKGRLATYEYTGAWSLFRLLLEHKPAQGEFGGGPDPSPQTLSFYVPTTLDRTLPQRKDATTAGQVRVYLQITVVPPGGKDGVLVSLPFPAQAPDVGGN